MVRVKSFIHGLIRENLGIKIGSLILASSIWWFVISQQEAEISFEVPLKVINIPRGIVLTDKSSATIHVRVRGLSNALTLLTESQIQLAIELESSAKAGDIVYQLRPKDIKVPDGIKVVSYNPSTVEITLEQENIKTLPVKVTVKGTPAEGFEIGETTIKPDTIRISG